MDQSVISQVLIDHHDGVEHAADTSMLIGIFLFALFLWLWSRKNHG